MEEFFNSNITKGVTFFLVTLFFICVPFLQGNLAKSLPIEYQKPYKKLANDFFIKSLLLYAGSIFAGLIAFINGDIDKAISQGFFGMCLFSSLGSVWNIIKTKKLISEARTLSVAGNREERILHVEYMNNEKALKSTIISILLGLSGSLYVIFLYDNNPFSWVWFVAFISTATAIASARWGETANISISKYASDASHGK